MPTKQQQARVDPPRAAGTDPVALSAFHLSLITGLRIDLPYYSARQVGDEMVIHFYGGHLLRIPFAPTTGSVQPP